MLTEKYKMKKEHIFNQNSYQDVIIFYENYFSTFNLTSLVSDSQRFRDAVNRMK